MISLSCYTFYHSFVLLTSYPCFVILTAFSDGASRSGTFIAITIILERFKTEQLVDVFQTIKKLRAFRPEFVENAVSIFFR